MRLSVLLEGWVLSVVILAIGLAVLVVDVCDYCRTVVCPMCGSRVTNGSTVADTGVCRDCCVEAVRRSLRKE